MIRTYLLLIILLLTFAGYSQKHASVWYFGEHAGLIFQENVQTVVNKSFIAESGCSVICDTTGNLLFYSNGQQVWNSNHLLMLNGDSLKGSPKLNQNSIIVPLPESDNTYFLFTISDQDTMKGFYYSVIDLNLDNGLGGIASKNIHEKTGVLEKLNAVKHCNDIDYWVAIHDSEDMFSVYLVDSNGFSNTPVNTSIGSVPKADVGYMKFSPRGDKLVLPVNKENLLAQIFDFDNKTGIISNPRNIYASENDTYSYGTAYSPSGDMLYLSTRGKDYSIWQYDLATSTENLSGERIATGNNFAMQLGPDGIIYIASENRTYLNAILNPDQKGLNCEYVSNAVVLEDSKSQMGLPNFVQSWFYKPRIYAENLCLGDITRIGFDGYKVFDSCNLRVLNMEGTTIFQTEEFPAYFQFPEPDNFVINVKYYQCDSEESFSYDIEISTPPESETRYATMYSGSESITLDAGEGYDSYTWSTGGLDRYETIISEGIYTVEVGKNGCTATDTIIVTEQLYKPLLPNAFSPNSDGLNDCFGILNPLAGINIKLMIFSRRGQILYESSDPFVCWDGRYKGVICPIGTYVYKVAFDSFSNGEIKVKQELGTVTIIR